MSSTSPQRRTALPRLAGAAVERARFSVVPRLRSKAPRVPFVTLVSLILLAGVVGLLLFNTSMQQAAFTASALEDRASDLSAQEEALAMELDQLRDPERLAAEACRAGMVVPPSAAFLDLKTGTVTGTPTAAVAAPCATAAPRPRKPQPAPADVTAADAATAETPADGTGPGEGRGAAGHGASHAEPLKLGR